MNKTKNTNFYVLLFSVAYFVSYITRINFGAIIAEMEIATGYSRTLLSASITGSFITYGTGQIVSGIFGDRVSPKKLVSVGFIITALMNLIIPFAPNAYFMAALWCINGFAQSFMWPPMVKLMTNIFTDEEYKKASVKVSWGSSFGTLAVYLISPVIITALSWKGVFLISSLSAVIILIVWNRYCIDSEQNTVSSGERRNFSLDSLLNPVMIAVMVAIILQGMLRDGVTTWMPSYIAETYNLSSVIAILTGIVLPVFSIISFSVTSKLYRDKLKNPLLCAGVLFALGAVSALLLSFSSGYIAGFSVVLSALLTGTMHGVNLILICMIPPFFKKSGNVSTVSGILNSCTYIGSAISTYGIAVLTEKFSWSLTLKIWILIALAGAIICLVCIKPWERKINKLNQGE